KRERFAIEKRYLAKSGSVVVSRVSVSLTRDSQGSHSSLVAIAIDVTAERQATDELAQSAALLRMAGRAAKMGAWRLTLPERSVVWSDEVCAIHEVPNGFSPDLEKALAFYEDDRVDEVTSHFEECIQNGIPFDFESQFVTAKGRRLWARVIGEVMRDASGAVTGLQGAFQDISERKEAEAKLQRDQAVARIAGNISKVGGWSISVPDAQVYWSREVWEMLGFPHDKEPALEDVY